MVDLWVHRPVCELEGDSKFKTHEEVIASFKVEVQGFRSALCMRRPAAPQASALP